MMPGAEASGMSVPHNPSHSLSVQVVEQYNFLNQSGDWEGAEDNAGGVSAAASGQVSQF